MFTTMVSFAMFGPRHVDDPHDDRRTQRTVRRAGGVGSALIQAIRQVGGAIGMALLGSFANSGYRDRLTLPSLPPAVTDALRGSVATGVQAAGRLGIPGLFDTVRAAFVGAMDTTLVVCGGVTALAAVLASLFLRPDRPAPAEPVSPADRPATGSVTAP